MTDTKIQRLRGIADWMALRGWTNMATNVREAADELERLDKIEDMSVKYFRLFEAVNEVSLAAITGSKRRFYEKLRELYRAMG